MAHKTLPSGALSAFFGSMSTMLGAGIQMDEAVYMLADSKVESEFRDTCSEIYKMLAEGNSLADAMEKNESFPSFSVVMVRAGEGSGRTEEVLRSLASYYNEEDMAFAKLRTAVTYPAALLCIMSAIMIFTVVFILPVFIDVYRNMTGSLTAGSFGAVSVSIAIGWIALAITVVLALGAATLTIVSRSAGRQSVMGFFERFPLTKEPFYQLALARFASALSTYLASGIDTETAMHHACELVTNPTLRTRVDKAYAAMTNPQEPLSIGQAIAEFGVFEPLYARMMQVGSITGSADETLSHLAQIFFEDSLEQIDAFIARIEPLLAAFMTLAVGTTLIAVMLPLIGIMRSIG